MANLPQVAECVFDGLGGSSITRLWTFNCRIRRRHSMSRSAANGTRFSFQADFSAAAGTKSSHVTINTSVDLLYGFLMNRQIKGFGLLQQRKQKDDFGHSVTMQAGDATLLDHSSAFPCAASIAAGGLWFL